MKLFFSTFVLCVLGTIKLLADPVLSEQQLAEIWKHSDGEAKLSREVHILLCWSKKDHREGRHDYPGFAKTYAERLNQVEKVTATTVFGFPSEEQLKKADLAILNHRNADFTKQQQAHVDAFLKAGKGMIVVHQGLAPTKGEQAWADRIGYAYVPGKKGSKWGIGELKMGIENSHPIFKGFPKQMSFNEELYWDLTAGETPGLKLLGKSSLPNKKELEWPLFWAVESGEKGEGGKVFCTVIGHYNDFTESPFFKMMIHRAAAWCLDEPFEAFAEIVKEK